MHEFLKFQNRHLVTHTGERQFPCNHCTQAFTQQQALKRHLTTHTGGNFKLEDDLT